MVWKTARHRAECQPSTWKILINCWRLALRINKDGTTKTRKPRNEKNEKTEVVPKKWRKQRKAGKVQQVIERGGVQVGTCERPWRCQSSPLRKRSKYLHTGYVLEHVSTDAIVRVPHAQGSKPHPLPVLLHHLARGNDFTAGPPCHSP